MDVSGRVPDARPDRIRTFGLCLREQNGIAAPRYSLTEALESEETTGVWFERERVYGCPRRTSVARTALRPGGRAAPGLESSEGPDWPGPNRDVKGLSMSTKLNDTQLVMLSAAAQRSDRCLVAPPNLKESAARRMADKLIAAGLVKEIKAKAGAPAWRRDEESGHSYALKIDGRGRESDRGQRERRSWPCSRSQLA